MLPRSVITLFCDDIREEKSGMRTLIGIYPDNINVPSFPYTFPKLGIYTRTCIDVEDSVTVISIRMLMPGRNEAELLTEIYEDTIAKAQTESREKGSPTCAIISQIMVLNYAVPKPGQMRMVVNVDNTEYIGGLINLRLSS